MPGKPGQSGLLPYEEEIRELFREGCTYRDIAERLNRAHGLSASHNAVYSFISAKRRRHLFHRSFLAGLDEDLQAGLMQQLTVEWTHDSTALEGNTLTLGETHQVLELGLTIGGKAVKDHEEVRGHARAIDLLRTLLNSRRVEAEDLFELHRAIMPRVPVDAMNPVGDWKRDFNGTTGVAEGKAVYMEYASPLDTPSLMARWLEGFNERLDCRRREEDAVDAYLWAHTAFVRIHPFFDGNGRLARLIANLPVLRAGFPPLTVAAEVRAEYIQTLWEYEWAVGKLGPRDPLLPPHPGLERLRTFLHGQWAKVMGIVAEARDLQKRRDEGRAG